MAAYAERRLPDAIERPKPWAAPVFNTRIGPLIRKGAEREMRLVAIFVPGS